MGEAAKISLKAIGKQDILALQGSSGVVFQPEYYKKAF